MDLRWEKMHHSEWCMNESAESLTVQPEYEEGSNTVVFLYLVISPFLYLSPPLSPTSFNTTPQLKSNHFNEALLVWYFDLKHFARAFMWQHEVNKYLQYIIKQMKGYFAVYWYFCLICFFLIVNCRSKQLGSKMRSYWWPMCIKCTKT